MVTSVVPEVLMGTEPTAQVTSIRLLETEQVSVTLPVKLFCGVTVTVEVTEVPGARVREFGLAVTAMSPDHCSTKLCASIDPHPVA